MMILVPSSVLLLDACCCCMSPVNAHYTCQGVRSFTIQLHGTQLFEIKYDSKKQPFTSQYLAI